MSPMSHKLFRDSALSNARVWDVLTQIDAAEAKGRSGTEEPHSASTSQPATCPRPTEPPDQNPSKSLIAAPSKSASTLTVMIIFQPAQDEAEAAPGSSFAGRKCIDDAEPRSLRRRHGEAEKLP